MKYQNNQIRIITVRVEMRKTKNEVVLIKKKQKAANFAHSDFRYHSENLRHRENFNFRYAQ